METLYEFLELGNENLMLDFAVIKLDQEHCQGQWKICVDLFNLQ